MRLTIILAVLLMASCNDSAENENDQPGKSRHDESFNQSVSNTLDAYYQLTESFVRYDSASIPQKARTLAQQITNLRPVEADSTDANYISQAHRHASFIADENALDEKKLALNALSENLLQYLKAVEYDREKLFYQECPMAFHDTESGFWLSAGDSIRNPYLGLHHPRYGKGMLKCGENKEVINYTQSEE